MTGVPCSSVPLIIRTSLPFNRWYRAKMSAGTAKPTTWPRCRFPAAYGQAGATRIFFEDCFANALLRLGEGHDTSRPLRLTPAAAQHKSRRECEQRKRQREQQMPPPRGARMRCTGWVGTDRWLAMDARDRFPTLRGGRGGRHERQRELDLGRAQARQHNLRCESEPSRCRCGSFCVDERLLG